MHSKLKKKHDIQKGDESHVRVSVVIIYYIIIKCLIVKKKKIKDDPS